MNLTNRKAGFTLMEIMIVSIIIGVLAATLGRGLMRRLASIKVNQTKTQLASIKNALIEYNVEKGNYPKKIEDMAEYLEGEENPVDSWDQEIIYNRPPVRYKKEKGWTRFEIYSFGADGEDNDNNIAIGE